MGTGRLRDQTSVWKCDGPGKFSIRGLLGEEDAKAEAMDVGVGRWNCKRGMEKA